MMVDEELFGEIVQLEQYGVEVRRVVQADALIDVATTI